MQLTAAVKFWLGGRDPLDYVSCYTRHADPQNAIPHHWHYVSFGFSDLFGDGRSFHAECTSSDGPSGFGYELTFRLSKLPGEEHAPSWPSDVMNTLGRYFLATGARVATGHNLQFMLHDHCPAKHLVVVEDPDLGTIDTPHGTVQFLQLVALTDEDLDMVQAWNSVDFTQLMRRELDTGGPLLVTDRNRSTSVLDLHPDWRTVVNQGIAKDGSSCAHSTGLFSFLPRYPQHAEGAPAVQPVGELQLIVDKHSAQSLYMALRGRILHGRGAFVL
jgi:suppressor of fused-like protein